MIKNVLTVGCSFTYGDELPNRLESAWPYLLAKQNNWQINNLGKGGGSNDRSIRLIFDNINKYDLIIIAWTIHDRFEVSFNDELVDVNIGYAKKVNLEWVEEYYKHHYDRLYSYSSWFRQILMLQAYLEKMGQKYIMVNAFDIWGDLGKHLYEEYMTDLGYLADQIDATYYPGWPGAGMCEWMGDCPKGPGGHPLELGHQRIAEKINEHIRHLGWIS